MTRSSTNAGHADREGRARARQKPVISLGAGCVKGVMTTETSLQRFVEAQESTYPTALAEIKRGRKHSHWMWFIFPQIQGLGISSTAQYYALKDATEAAAYLKHPVLGSRLLEICAALFELPGHDATRIFGYPDDLKLRSCLTLFASLPGSPPVFQLLLDKFFQGAPDGQTLRILSQNQSQRPAT